MTVSYLPVRNPSSVRTTTTLGLDLTALGVLRSGPMFADLPVAKADLTLLTSYMRTAHSGGVAFVSLGADFRSRSDEEARRQAWLDPLVTARRLGPHAGGGVVASVPAASDLAPVAAELAHLRTAPGAWTGLELSEHEDPDRAIRMLDEIRGTFSATHPHPPRVVLAAHSEPAVEAGARLADAVRIREKDLAWARELRYAVRAAARASGREDVRVLVDLHVVVAADRATAEARAELVADIDGPHAPGADALSAVGTASDVAGLIETWVQAGAADGFVILPGSLRADVQPLLREVLPELRARGLMAEHRSPAPPLGGTARHTAPYRSLVVGPVA